MVKISTTVVVAAVAIAPALAAFSSTQSSRNLGDIEQVEARARLRHKLARFAGNLAGQVLNKKMSSSSSSMGMGSMGADYERRELDGVLYARHLDAGVGPISESDVTTNVPDKPVSRPPRSKKVTKRSRLKTPRALAAQRKAPSTVQEIRAFLEAYDLDARDFDEDLYTRRRRSKNKGNTASSSANKGAPNQGGNSAKSGGGPNQGGNGRRNGGTGVPNQRANGRKKGGFRKALKGVAHTFLDGVNGGMDSGAGFGGSSSMEESSEYQ